MSSELTNINVGPRALADGFLITPEQWLSLQVGMARFIYGTRLGGLPESDFQQASKIARTWLFDVSPTSLSLVQAIRGYGQAHTQKFAADASEVNVDQLRQDLADLHNMATSIQAQANAVFQKLEPLAQQCAALKEQLIAHQMWDYELDQHLTEMQYVIGKMEGVWGGLASDIQYLADRTTNLDGLSAILVKVRDKGVLRAWQSVVDEADGFLFNAIQIPTTSSSFGQSFTDNEGSQRGVSLCGAAETGLELGDRTAWYLVPCDKGFFYIFTQDNWQCLTAELNSDLGWLFPTLSVAGGSDHEKWQFVPAANDQVLIVSKANGQCLASEQDGDGNIHLLTTHLLDRSRDSQSYDSGVANLRWFVTSND